MPDLHKPQPKPPAKSHPHALFDRARFVFLDRDGVINRKRPEGQYVTDPAQFELLPGAADAIARLNRSGRTVIVVTNQRGVSLGRMTAAAVDSVHAELRRQLAPAGARVDALYVCPHNRGECLCRKPATGMIEAAFRDFPGASPENSILLGDSLSDVQCARAAGLPAIFIEGEAEHRKPGADAAAELADAVAASLAEAVPFPSEKKQIPAG